VLAFRRRGCTKAGKKNENKVIARHTKLGMEAEFDGHFA
jgi:hypothetical protein